MKTVMILYFMLVFVLGFLVYNKGLQVLNSIKTPIELYKEI